MAIVGIIADARLDRMDQQALPEVFTAMAQLPTADASIIARARAAPIRGALRKAVHDICLLSLTRIDGPARHAGKLPIRKLHVQGSAVFGSDGPRDVAFPVESSARTMLPGSKAILRPPAS